MKLNCYGADCTAWTILHPRITIDALGYIPAFLSEDDPRPAREQFTENYVWGGWRPFEGFGLLEDGSLKYPGDPAYPPLASRKFRGETIILYPHSWVMVKQAEGSWEVSRMD